MSTTKATPRKATPGAEGAFNAGVGTVDDKGRLTLSKPARNFTQGVDGWLTRVNIERHPRPSASETRTYRISIMPALRHLNDLPAVVTAILAQPDWMLSTNTAHWNEALAARTGLRIATPLVFLSALVPAEQP